MMFPNRSRRVLALMLAALVALSATAGALARGQAPLALTARPATAVARFSQDSPWDSRANAKQGVVASKLVSVIVKLADAPLAAYAGGLPGLAPTSPSRTGAARLDAAAPDSLRYLAYLDQRLRDFEARALAAIPQARVVARYRYVYGGVSVVLPEQEIARLAALPGVVAVQRDHLRHVDTDRSPQFVGADVIWRALAANPDLGDGGDSSCGGSQTPCQRAGGGG